MFSTEVADFPPWEKSPSSSSPASCACPAPTPCPSRSGFALPAPPCRVRARSHTTYHPRAHTGRQHRTRGRRAVELTQSTFPASRRAGAS